MDQQVTLSQMQQQGSQEVVTAGFSTSASFELMQRQANMLAASTLVPQQYRDNLSNCVIALNMANRVGADPLMVMQNLYVVHGTPGWSAKFLIASFNQCGRFSSVRYEWKGNPGDRDYGCRAWAMEKATNERVESPWITWDLVRAEKWDSKNGSKWKTMPEKMFMYRSAAWLVDTVAPEISMGLQTADQINETFDAKMDETGAYSVTTQDLKQEEKAVTPDDEASPDQEIVTLPATYASVAGDIKNAKTADDVELAESLIGSVKNEIHRGELIKQLNTKKQELGAA